MKTTLVRGRSVICKVYSPTEVEVIDAGGVLVRDDRIEKIGKFEDLLSLDQHDEIIGDQDSVIFPGFVDAHHHTGLTPVQLGSPDMALELWWIHRIRARLVDPYLDTLYSAFELIRSGVTTVQHMQPEAYGSLSMAFDSAQAVIRAYQDIGMRVSYSYCLTDQNVLTHEADDLFAKRLPDDLALNVRSFVDGMAIPLEENFDLLADLRAEHENDPTVSIQLAPTNLHWCSDEALARVGETSRELGIPMHLHMVESQYQKAYAHTRGQATAVQYIDKMGLLGPSMTLGHCVWVTEDDLDLIAETGTHICHNCSSNMRVRGGTAPLNAMRERGIKVGIGIDEAGLNDDRDMLTELRLVLRAHRIPGLNDEEVPSAAEVFRMATEDGAHTTQFGGNIGTIEEGKLADLVLVDWKQVAYPYLDEEVPIVDALIQRAKTSGVQTVMINGTLVLKDGVFTRVDEKASLAELATSLDRPSTSEEINRRDFAKRLLPHIREYYEAYAVGPIDTPFSRMNSRY